MGQFTKSNQPAKSKPATENAETPQPEPAQNGSPDAVVKATQKVAAEINNKMPDLTKEEFDRTVQRAVMEALLKYQPMNAGGTTEVIMPETGMYDTDDIMEKPVMFYSFRWGYSIYGGKKFGMQNPHPFNRPVKFEHIATVKNGVGGRENKIIQVSRAEVYSKKECKWLREHVLYGVEYFEEMNKLQDFDYDKHMMNYEASLRLSNMSQFEIVSLAKQKSLPPSHDLQALRLLLIPIIAAEMLIDKKRLQAATVQMTANSQRLIEEKQLMAR